MDLIGLINRITEATTYIDRGRKGYAIKGKADDARVSYERGIAEAMGVFKEAQSAGDPQSIILAEYTFLTQELQLCAKTDKNTINSLVNAIQYFDDAFLVLKIVEEKALYHIVNNAIPNNKKYRIKGYPKDSFHIACGSHDTRIKNMLNTPGIDPIEKALLEQRRINLSTAQISYVDKQKKAMEN